MTFIDWLIVALFLGTLMAIGYAFSRKNKDVEDYFVAGRSMPGWIVAIAATGTTISAGTFVGSPELGFNTDLTYVLNLLGAIVGGMLVAALIMPKLYKANTITIKNGTLDAGTTAFCALCSSSVQANLLTVNLEGVHLINNMSNGSTIKWRGGAILNVKAGTIKN